MASQLSTCSKDLQAFAGPKSGGVIGINQDLLKTVYSISVGGRKLARWILIKRDEIDFTPYALE